jgi:tetratricopeptide (TPR) repeat protein
MHLVKKDIHSNYTNDSLWLVSQLEKKYPGKTFNVWNGLNTNNAAIMGIIRKEKITKPAFLHTSQTELGNLDFATILPFKASRSNQEGKMIDSTAYKPMAMKDNFSGILYLGTSEEASFVEPRLQTIYDDTLYLNELIRRASTRKEVFGFHLQLFQYEKAKRSKEYKDFSLSLQSDDTTTIEKKYRRLKTQFADFDIGFAGFDFLQQKQFKKALKVYELAIKEYPKEFNFYDGLADAHMAVGEKSKAIKYYQKAIDLNPGAKEIKAKLEQLKNKS